MYRNEDFFRVIGHISVFFATLDFFVSQVIVELKRPTASGGAPFRDNATLGQKFEVLGSLKPADVTNAEVLTAVRAILPRAMASAAERNRYMHDQWVFAPDLIRQGRIQRVRLTFLLKAAMSREELSMEDLLRFQGEVGDLQVAFADFWKALNPTALKAREPAKPLPPTSGGKTEVE